MPKEPPSLGPRCLLPLQCRHRGTPVTCVPNDGEIGFRIAWCFEPINAFTASTRSWGTGGTRGTPGHDGSFGWDWSVGPWGPRTGVRAETVPRDLVGTSSGTTRCPAGLRAVPPVPQYHRVRARHRVSGRPNGHSNFAVEIRCLDCLPQSVHGLVSVEIIAALGEQRGSVRRSG